MSLMTIWFCLATIVITTFDRQFDAAVFRLSTGPTQQSALACTLPDLVSPEPPQPPQATTD
jgi:hypothetical protein